MKRFKNGVACDNLWALTTPRACPEYVENVSTFSCQGIGKYNEAGECENSKIWTRHLFGL